MWRKRTLHLKWASVSTEMKELERQEKGEREISSGYEKDNRWAVVSAAESYSRRLSTRHLENTVESSLGIKKRRGLNNWEIGRGVKGRNVEEENNSFHCRLREKESTENQLEDEFLLALSSAGNPTLSRPLRVLPFYLPVLFVVAIYAFSVVACFKAVKMSPM